MEPLSPPVELFINAPHWRAMCKHADAGLPDEACGIVAGRDARSHAVLPLTNAAHSPSRYEVAPEELFAAFSKLQRRRWELLAIFHSHPLGDARPSAVDMENAHYPHTAYLILAPRQGTWTCRGFHIDRTASEIPVHLG